MLETTTTIQVAPVEPILVNTQVAAKMLGLGVSYFSELVDQGVVGPMPVRLGKRVLHSVRLLRRWESMGMPDRAEFLRLLDDFEKKSGVGACSTGTGSGSADRSTNKNFVIPPR